MLKVNSGETRWLLLPPDWAIRRIYTLVTARRHDHTAECYTRSDTNSPTWKPDKSQMWPTRQTTAFRAKFELKFYSSNFHSKVSTSWRKWTFLVFCNAQNASVAVQVCRTAQLKVNGQTKPKSPNSPSFTSLYCYYIMVAKCFCACEPSQSDKGAWTESVRPPATQTCKSFFTSSICSLALSSQRRQKEMLSSLFTQVEANLVYNASGAAATHLNPSPKSHSAGANTPIEVTLCC